MLTNLPRLTRDEVKLLNLMASCSQMAQRAMAWLPKIQKTLTETIGESCQINFKRASVEPTPQIAGALFGVSWPPQAGVLVIESDIKTLQRCAYKAIGSQTMPQDLDPKLSDLETGIVLFVLSRVFESTQEAFQHSDLSQLPQTALLCLSFEFKLGDLNSFIRIWVSPEMLTQDDAALALKRGQERCALAQIPLRLELSTIELTPEEFKGLEPGDIVVLENSSLKSVQGFLGDSESPALTGSVTPDEKTGIYTFTLGSSHDG